MQHDRVRLARYGGSFPGGKLSPGAHTNTEDSYVGTITTMVKKLS